MKKINFIIRFFCLCLLVALSVPLAAQGSVSGVAEWGQFHLSYTIAGADLEPRETVSTGSVLTYHYTGKLAGNTLTISGKGWGDVPVSDQNYPWIVTASVSVDGNTKKFEYKDVTPGEKLNQSFSLSVPIPANARSGSFSMEVLYHSAYRVQGNAVTGTLTRGSGAVSAPVVPKEVKPTVDTPTPKLGDKLKLTATIKLIRGSLRVYIGQTLSFKAQVSSPDGTVPPAGLVYRWEPSTEVAFTPFEGTGNTATGRFSRLGKVRVWVDVLQKSGTVLSTVAESNQLDIEVVAPEINLRSFPALPYPGQEVRITASESPPVGDDLITYWWEYAGSAINPGALADPRIFTYKPKNWTTPVTVTAHAKAKDGGDDLGTKAIMITARPYIVRVTGPIVRKPKPKVWSAAEGRLVDDEQPLAVFQDVSMRADVRPTPINQPLHYQWTVAPESPEGCLISNPISQEPTFNCSQTGSFTVLVTVRDHLGATLGTGTGQILISNSQESFKAPRLIRRVEPEYPSVAYNALVQGVVILEATIEPNGRVSNVTIIHGILLLDQAAIDAVRQWVYEPLTQTVPLIKTVTVTFSLNSKSVK